ncbi:MAG TPA: hypothetical protein VNO52_04885, partial [Methylomirabilota bacterium]|nr:hypothetical protein [Methylomirabilota bacterium]
MSSAVPAAGSRPPVPTAPPKTGIFALEALNILGVVLYYNYLFFFAREQFGFGNLENLLLSALNGFLYIPGSLLGGWLAQRRGCFFALKLGLVGLILALTAGGFCSGALAQTIVLAAWTLPVCLTWPALEALTAEHENPRDLPHRIGLYNVVWAGGAAAAYFGGGLVIEALGWKSLFWLPATLHVLQLALALRCEQSWRRTMQDTAPAAGTASAAPMQSVRADVAASFRRMAWLANPFAYIAMNTVLPLMPGLAATLGLSTAQAGFVCSVWMFARLAAFFALWHWTGWHYRFGWLLGAYVLLIASFALILLVPTLWVLVLAQLLFGGAVGLIYYSSLYYSMNQSDTKGAHGGVHEAAIGIGIFAGPAVGALALRAAPAWPTAGAWAVSALLVLGLALIWRLR